MRKAIQHGFKTTIIRDLAASGTSILMISSDFDALAICDRVVVMRSTDLGKTFGPPVMVTPEGRTTSTPNSPICT